MGLGSSKRFVAALAAALLVAGCGGGDLVEPFRPTRQLSFGDESSVLTDTGRNYGVNGINSSGVFDCSLNPNWVQYLAARFGFVFAQCNPGAVAAPQAILYAAPGAKVADVVAQIDAHVAAGGFGPLDMVTVLVGANDVLELYAQFAASGEAALIEELRRRGTQLAEQINRIANLDGRVIVATVPDLAFTPFAAVEEAANPGRAALLSRLTFALNARMRANLINDGRRIGIVLADDMVEAIARNPGIFGFANASQVACAVAPPDCTTTTLVSGGNAVNWLWSGATLLSTGGQLRLGSLAETRARNNPF